MSWRTKNGWSSTDSPGIRLPEILSQKETPGSNNEVNNAVCCDGYASETGTGTFGGRFC